jgi:uncharacterized protein (UPF0332 family)
LDPFEDCLKKGRLRSIEPDLQGIRSEMSTARDELDRARRGFARNRHEESLVQSYFAMCRSVKSLLWSKGYKDTNVYSLIAGLRKLFVETGQLDESDLAMLAFGKDQKDHVYNGAQCHVRDSRRVLRHAEVLFGKTVRLLEAQFEFTVQPSADAEPAGGSKPGEDGT